jgi:hypothetical protein
VHALCFFNFFFFTELMVMNCYMQVPHWEYQTWHLFSSGSAEVALIAAQLQMEGFSHD